MRAPARTWPAASTVTSGGAPSARPPRDPRPLPPPPGPPGAGPEAPSRGRKPSPRFLFDARDQFHLDLGHSYMVGDKLIDLECGWNAGVRQSILVRTGYGAELERSSPEKLGAAVIVDDLTAAAEWISRNG